MSAGQNPPRIGVMGGTFDPIHHGHLVAASEVAHFFALDEVIFVPTGQPWQKDGREVSAPEDRYLMTVIATASNPRFSVSRVDIDRPGPTYTIDTLRELRAARGPDAEFYFITGADALQQIMTWQDADELFKLAHFVGCTRPGHRLTGAGLPDDKVSLIEIPALAISSTTCRQRVAAGVPIWYLVPDGIVQYISKRKLYRQDAGQPGGLSGVRRYPEQGAPERRRQAGVEEDEQRT
jgi:nicotinate-nucleotide adenylyltransferase